ncbi:dolichol-P-glucose synthetase [Aquipluma nitroreducens]|uniref:Dolichol-P-glucose synthetase n=1 Tax=Aquipluma nitroreducens TaxID=2010828 RepID=A0A5K7SDL1_9BACT|nr:lysylphosphatidylglycerol synthase transmembrane domain-containing protein [Aquipluma nitroreducens]BBE19344.1 dolichol-P-glucose synthetase [Aquipluma nitroreducens]
MKQNILKTLKFVSFFALGIFIFWMVYKDQDFNRIKSILTNDVNYFWIVVSLLLGLLSHVSRTIRWNLLIEPLGRKPRLMNTFLAVMVGYLMNLALPRMGEISRCGVIARYEKISFTKLVGTVVTERLIDVLMLLILLVIVVLTQFGQVLEFLNNNPEVNEKLQKVIYSPVLIGGLLLFFAVLWLSRHKIRESSLMKRVMGFVGQFVEGFRSIGKMKRKGSFIFHSVFIWVLYYLMMYLIFFSFGFTSNLGPLAGLTVFVLGSFGMVAPVQGGIGAWHFMVIEGLALYGVDRVDGKVFALLAHGTSTVMLIVLGLIGVLVLPFVNEREEVLENSH